MYMCSSAVGAHVPSLTFFAPGPLPVALVDTAAATIFTLSPPSQVHPDAAATQTLNVLPSR